MESTWSSESRITVESDYIGGLSCEKITRTHSLPGSLDRARETAVSSSDMRLCRAATCKTVVELAGENRVHVLKVWGNRLGYPISFSTPSWPSFWADWQPGLLYEILAGSTKNTPSHLAGSTKMPLFKKYPKKSKYGNTIFFQC